MRGSRKPSIFVLVCSLSFVALALQGAVTRGEWAINDSGIPDRLDFSLHGSDGPDYQFNTSSYWPVTEFTGLDFKTAARHDVHFTITRDAGTFECQGFVEQSRGAGLFEFRPNQNYSSQLASIGFAGVTDEHLMSFAIHDVSLSFARQIKNENLSDLDPGKLIAFRIHGVTPEFIHTIHAEGVNTTDSGQLIAFRIHGVSPEFIRSLKTAGIGTTDPGKLIAFRIHGVSPEFVQQVVQMGYGHPPADKLIAMRIHGVTPEYIQQLKSRGVQNLTLDQLIALRIQGIN